MKCQQRFSCRAALSRYPVLQAMAPGPCDGVAHAHAWRAAQRRQLHASPVVADENAVSKRAGKPRGPGRDATKILQEPKMIFPKGHRGEGGDVVAPAVALQARSKVKMMGHLRSSLFSVFSCLWLDLLFALLGNEDRSRIQFDHSCFLCFRRFSCRWAWATRFGSAETTVDE